MKSFEKFIITSCIVILNSVCILGVVNSFDVHISNSSGINNPTQNRLMPAFCSKKTGCYA
ncbi:hypothetical protein J6E39_03145 [bacterium]|nr:hypothetical protein [bacterium]